jgi:hypothetical protein
VLVEVVDKVVLVEVVEVDELVEVVEVDELVEVVEVDELVEVVDELVLVEVVDELVLVEVVGVVDDVDEVDDVEVVVDVVVVGVKVVLVVVVLVVVLTNCLMSKLTTGVAGNEPPRNCANVYALAISLSVSARSHITKSESRMFPYLTPVRYRAICVSVSSISGGAVKAVDLPQGTLFLNNSSVINVPFFECRIAHTAHSFCTITPLVFDVRMLLATLF